MTKKAHCNTMVPFIACSHTYMYLLHAFRFTFNCFISRLTLTIGVSSKPIQPQKPDNQPAPPDCETGVTAYIDECDNDDAVSMTTIITWLKSVKACTRTRARPGSPSRRLVGLCKGNAAQLQKLAVRQSVVTVANDVSASCGRMIANGFEVVCSEGRCAIYQQRQQFQIYDYTDRHLGTCQV
jgi:hypothetical protein